MNELHMLGLFRHPHLVPLTGFCISNENSRALLALIYPRMSSSLEDALHSQHGAADALLASARLSIALDAGLAYLHSSGISRSSSTGTSRLPTSCLIRRTGLASPTLGWRG